MARAPVGSPVHPTGRADHPRLLDLPVTGVGLSGALALPAHRWRLPAALHRLAQLPQALDWQRAVPLPGRLRAHCLVWLAAAGGGHAAARASAVDLSEA